jgi:tRNA dimethylallyltransferase
LAVADIAVARADGRMPILCGGTGLYLKALMGGLTPIPEIPDAVREAVRARIARDGSAAAHVELAGRDPASAGRIAPGDSQRIARALEVLESTGRPLSAWRAERPGSSDGLSFLALLIDPPRDALYAAVEARFAAMMEGGAVEEVRALLALGLAPTLPAMKALGVRELAAHLRGEIAAEEARDAAVRATRNYVKRQATWFRHQLAPDVILPALVPPIPDAALQAVDRFLAATPS